MMRFHLAGLPHTDLSEDYLTCAYTQKAIKFIKMMTDRGHEVIPYWGEGDNAKMPHWPEDEAWADFNDRARQEILVRYEPGDIILLAGGRSQESLLDLPGPVVEYGIGYEGTCADCRVFESYAWMHFVHGLQHDDNGHFYDAVIPNAVDPNDFPFQPKKGNYFLFVGRVVSRKGVQIAAEVCKRLGERLIVAGPESDEVDIASLDVEHVGTVGAKQRADLMGGARALFVPTTYLEPFGGVSIEAMMCGTPVITTDWGAFSENVVDGKTGYRFRTFGEALYAAEHVDVLDNEAIRNYALANFSCNRVGQQYEAYFRQLETLRGNGWYDETDWSYLNRYRKYGII